MTDQQLDHFADWLDREAKQSDLPTDYLQGRMTGLRDAFEYLAILRMQVKKESEERRQDDDENALAGRAGLAGLFEAAKQADWIQVALNAIGTGDAPCFHLEDGRFCLRADRWAGHEDAHAKGSGHHFVSLEALLRSLPPNAPASATEGRP